MQKTITKKRTPMTIKAMTLCAVFVALTAIGAQITVPLGPVPFTLQTLFVGMAGILLGSKLGALSMALYAVIGLCGAPVFAKMGGGFQSLTTGSFGFVIGFILSAFVTGWLYEKFSKKIKSSLLNMSIASVIGVLPTYIFGTAYGWMLFNVVNPVPDKGLSYILYYYVIMFVPTQLVKLAIGIVLCHRLKPILNKIFGNNVANSDLTVSEKA